MRTDPMLPVPAIIRGVTRETGDTFTIDIAPPDGVFAFAPGQFNMLYAFGSGEVPISISGDPSEPEKLIHTIRAVGTVTRMIERLGTGDAVGVRGPFGKAWPVADAEGKDLIIVAGGIGLAPLRPVIYHALRHRKRYGRMIVAYGTRTPADILYDEELMRWRARFDLEVQVTVDRGDAAWRGKTGVVTRLLERASFAPDAAVAMLCGPEIMMRFAARELMHQGMAATAIHVTLERNMQCAIAHCGHCQLGPELLCRDGAVYPYANVERLLSLREL